MIINGNLLAEIKALLAEEGAIEPSAALRVSLTLQAEMYSLLLEHTKKLEKVERLSIGLWMVAHPKIAISIVLSYIAMVAMHFAGIETIIPAIVKLFGI